MNSDGGIAMQKGHFIWFWHTFSSVVLWRCLQVAPAEDEGKKQQREEKKKRSAIVVYLWKFPESVSFDVNQFQCNRSACCLKRSFRLKSSCMFWRPSNMTGSGCNTWFHLMPPTKVFVVALNLSRNALPSYKIEITNVIQLYTIITIRYNHIIIDKPTLHMTKQSAEVDS